MTQTTKMSITRALSTLKAQKEEIGRLLSSSNPLMFLGLTIGNDGKQTNVPTQDAAAVARTIQGNYDKVNGLIERQVSLKNAINISNHATKVTVAGQEMTVAEAILLKGTIELRAELLKKMRASYTSAAGEFEKTRQAVETRINAIVTQSVNDETPADRKAEMLRSTREAQELLFAPTYIDPLKLADKIKDSETQVNFVLNELDYVLSESNTLTQIDVEM